METSVLVVFHSNCAVCRKVAQHLATRQRWDIAEVTESSSRGGMIGFLRGMLDALLHRKLRIRYEGREPLMYERVVVVSPVQALRLSKPMRAFIDSRAPLLRNLSAVITTNKIGARNAFADVTQLLGKPPKHTLALTRQQLATTHGDEALHQLSQRVAAELPVKKQVVARKELSLTANE
ncbi:MAG TPA: hypothetical protein VFS42_02405 [Burkholderiaceae bacterium]|nr:hypothetical protein [Burkholderiaceae bacterium]